MKKPSLILLFLFFASVGCRNEDIDTNEGKFVPNSVFVKIKAHFYIDKVFDLINSLDHDVNDIQSQFYSSELPSDSLQYVLDYLNAKPYTNDGKDWYVTGYVNNDVIFIRPPFFNMKNLDYQNDWLECVELLKLNERNGGIIHFHVPEGQEKLWVKKFKEYEFVEWAKVDPLIKMNPGLQK